MKLKKLLLFILIFFFCLVIKNNVNAYVVNEGGQGKYYLKDLPFSEEEYDTVFIYSSNANKICCFGIEKSFSLGFDASTKCFYKFDSFNNVYDFIHVYTCSLENVDGLLVGSEWNFVSVASGNPVRLANNNDYKYIGGSVPIYICSSTYIIKNLPNIQGLTWNSQLFIINVSNQGDYVAKLIRPSVPDNDYFFTAMDVLNPHCIRYTNSFDYTGANVDVYGYNITTNSWDYLKTVSTNGRYGCLHTQNEGGDIRNNLLYLPVDIYKYSADKEILHSKNNYIFSGLFSYNSFPYILNGQEDLAKGEEDIIIMPRRF